MSLQLSEKAEAVPNPDNSLRHAILISARSIDPEEKLSDPDYRTSDMLVSQVTSEMLEDTPENRASLLGIVVSRYIPEGTPFVKRDLEVLPDPAPAPLIVETVLQEEP